MTDKLIGIGYGPANLALAVAFREADTGPSRIEFLETQERFGWHRDMLLPGATMQISFLKDLVTVRNPRSEFSFINYLADRGRMLDFINLKSFYPTRIEFHDYLEWVADRVRATVRYGETVRSVEIGRVDGVHRYRVMSTDRDGQPRVRTARHLAIGTGLTPRVPAPFPTDHPRVVHTSRFLSGLTGLDRAAPLRFAVVGAGQSAAEAAEYLHTEFARSTVHVVHSRFGYSPSDDTPFVNRIFDPDATEAFYDATEPAKAALLRYHANTNYSVVDADLITALYRRHYVELVDGRSRLRFHRGTRVENARPEARAVTVELRDLTGRGTVLTVDLLVLATGYRPMAAGDLLRDPDGVFALDRLGRFVVNRDYSLRTARRPHGLGNVYVQGGSEQSHGISSTLLSNLATSSGQIVRSLAEFDAATARKESVRAEAAVD